MLCRGTFMLSVLTMCHQSPSLAATIINTFSTLASGDGDLAGGLHVLSAMRQHCALYTFTARRGDATGEVEDSMAGATQEEAQWRCEQQRCTTMMQTMTGDPEATASSAYRSRIIGLAYRYVPECDLSCRCGQCNVFL